VHYLSFVVCYLSEHIIAIVVGIIVIVLIVIIVISIQRSVKTYSLKNDNITIIKLYVYVYNFVKHSIVETLATPKYIPLSQSFHAQADVPCALQRGND
jgi:high-affinity Fe2+/Pb2+ permease